MATEIVRWCDVHVSRDERVKGAEVRLSLGGHPAKSLDLCDACRDELIKPIEALLDEFGATVRGDAPTGRGRPRKGAPEAATLPVAVVDPDARFRCLFCPAVYGTANGAYRHMRVDHGTPEGAQALLGTVCPVCGFEGEKSASVHIALGHKPYGFASVLDAYAWARDNGDPHGVWAEVAAKAR